MRATLPAIALTFALSACSGPEQAARRIPLDVREQAEVVVDEVMARDLSALREAFPDETSAEFESFLERSADAVRMGDEVARNLVGAQVARGNSGASYRIAHEVETDAGFTVVSQTYGGPFEGPVVLRQLEVEGSDASLAAKRRRLGMATWLIAGAFLIGLILTLALFVRSRRRTGA